MDDITRAVGALYDAHPYPASPPQLRADGFPRLLVGYVEARRDRPRVDSRPLVILDAGCGTGAGLIPVAELSSDDRFVGVDISATAIAHLRTQKQHRGLDNLELYVADIMDPDALAPVREHAPEGFDVIYASGVIHHLSQPDVGLRNLAQMLAPDGVMSLMVYGHHGRMPVTRVARAIDIARPGGGFDSDRVAFCRQLVQSLGPGSVAQPPWNDGAVIGDAELVDRYLHVHARSYTVTQLFELLTRAGLTFVRWLEPRLWSPTHIFGPGSLTDELEMLPDIDRYRVIECLFDRNSLEVLASGPKGRARPPLTSTTLRDAVLAWNPQTAVTVTERRAGDDEWSERVRVRVRSGPESELTGLGAALVQLARRPTPAPMLVERATQLVFAASDAAYAALHELVAEEVLYAPA